MLCLRGVVRSLYTNTARGMTRGIKTSGRQSCPITHPCPTASPSITGNISPVTLSSPLTSVRRYHELRQEHLYDSEGNELPLLRFLRMKEKRDKDVRFIDSPEADYFVDRNEGGEFDVSEVECTDVLVMPYPIRTVIKQVYGDYNVIVEQLLSHLQSKVEFPPTYIHIDAGACSLQIPGQYGDLARDFLHSRGF